MNAAAGDEKCGLAARGSPFGERRQDWSQVGGRGLKRARFWRGRLDEHSRDRVVQCPASDRTTRRLLDCVIGKGRKHKRLSGQRA